MQHTHWLVTKGARPGTQKITPIVLMPITGDLRDLTQVTRDEVDRRAAIFLSPNPDLVERMRAISGDYYLQTVNDLWFREVTPAAHTGDRSLPAGVAALEFVLRRHKRDVPTWQGPAEGVIPVATPRILFNTDTAPARLSIIDP